MRLRLRFLLRVKGSVCRPNCVERPFLYSPISLKARSGSIQADYAHFLNIAESSVAEMECLLIDL